jgi:RNA polymerase sigma-70 factor (ECF subfamily)
MQDTTEAVIARYTRTVYSVALTHTGNRSDADDVFQEVFLAYHRAHPVFNSEEHRKAWLLRTTLNHCLKVTQGPWRTRTAALTEEGQAGAAAHAAENNGHPAVEDFTLQTERQDLIFRAMQALPPAQRTVIHLFYFEDLPVQDIAEILDEQPGTVKTRLSRARAQMREQMQAMQLAEDSLLGGHRGGQQGGQQSGQRGGRQDSMQDGLQQAQ